MDWDISSIPAGSSIGFAQLNLGDHTINGTPFATLGTLKVGAVNYGTCDVGDAGIIFSAFTSLSSPPTAAAPLNVTDQVRAAFNEGRAFQLALRFALDTDGDGVIDEIRWSEVAGHNTLAVTYTPP